MDLARALDILLGQAVPIEQPHEYGQAQRVVLNNLSEIRKTLQRMGYTPTQAQDWTDHLRRTIDK